MCQEENETKYFLCGSNLSEGYIFYMAPDIIFYVAAICQKTRLDTRPPVADGWAEADMRIFQLERDGLTNRRADGQTDKTSYRVGCPQLKTIFYVASAL